MTAVAETNDEAGETTARSARLRHLIVTIYGLYARSDGGWLSVAALIRLLGDLQVEEPAARSAISRLKRRGILQSQRYGGAAGYQLSADALEILREGDARIFRRQRAALADGWLLAVFSVPEAQRHRRHVLRSELARLGFGMVAPGVWITPAHPQDTTAQTLRRLGLDAYADLFHADHLAFGDPAAKIRGWWDLAGLARQYESFIRAHEPVLRRWQRGGADAAGGSRGLEATGRSRGLEAAGRSRGLEAAGRSGGLEAAGREAFADYTRALTDWRRFPYLDPGLPAELLPDGWIGIGAAQEFFDLRALLEEPAREYVQAVISG